MLLQPFMSLEDYFKNNMCQWFEVIEVGYTYWYTASQGGNQRLFSLSINLLIIFTINRLFH